MAQQSSGEGRAGTTPGPEGEAAGAGTESDAARLDRLERRVAELAQSVEAGLVAQARRVESVVGTARRELVDAITDRSELVAAVDRAVREVLGSARSTGGGAIDDEEPPGATGTELRDELQQDRLTFREGLRRDAEELQERVGDEVRSVREHVQAVLEQTVERLTGDDAVASSSVEGVSERLGTVVDDLAARLEATEQRLDATLASLRSAHESLLAHLVDRDRQVALERAQLTRAFVEELAGTLSKRERRRVARRLSVEELASSEPTSADAASPAAAPPQPAVPEPVGARDTPAANVPVREPTPEDEDVETEEGLDDELAELDLAEEAQVEDEAEAPVDRVQPSLRTRPVHDRASTPKDPAAMRRTLAAVRGLGPARQAALISAFDSLDELREASDEELLAVRGIGPSLLEPIRSVL